MFELLLLLLILGFFILTIFILIKSIKQIFAPPEKLKFKMKVFFINGYQNHNNIVNLQKGECEFKLKDGYFYLVQDKNIIEDNIFDIYNIRTWTYQSYTYIAIKMKTSSEYIFSLNVKTDEESKIIQYLALSYLKCFQTLCNKLKIDFAESGESQSQDYKE